jgi:hypothetical protein
MTTTDTTQALLEAAHEAVRLQLFTRRDRELIQAVLAHHPTLIEAEAIEALQLASGL